MSMTAVVSKAVVVSFGMAAALASATEITVTRPYSRWLFGGLGFQNSEANLVPLMTDEFRDQYAIKTFLEISPTFSRTIGGFANQSKESMDRWADFYDRTFRIADTTLDVYPLVMPGNPDTIDPEQYAEEVAKNLEYLINVRKCRKIRYYTLTNELMAGNEGNWFKRGDNMQLFRAFNAALWKAFRDHRLDVKLLATDVGAAWPYEIPASIQWAKENMAQYCGAYCGHWYFYAHDPSDLKNWDYLNEQMASFVAAARGGGKRFILGEYGFNPHYRVTWNAMGQDTGYAVCRPDLAAAGALVKAEMAMAAVCQGVYAAANWSFVDYPDPLVREPSDDPVLQAQYEATQCAYGADYKYNKWGCFRWNQHDRDYRAYPELYAIGHLTRLFKRGSTVLPCVQDDLDDIRSDLPVTNPKLPCADPRVLRVSAIQNEDQSVSMAILNRGEDGREITVNCPWFAKDVRRYDFIASRPPENPFNDLQGVTELLSAREGKVSLKMAHDSLVILTTDYKDVVPAAVKEMAHKDGVLSWKASESPDHRYYRVYCNGKQIASTVATKLATASKGDYEVHSVDKWLNEGR